MNIKFGKFYLDKEKDIVVNLFLDEDGLFYVLETPNHHTGNLISNLAKVCNLAVSFNENGLKVITNRIPCYIDGNNQTIYIMHMGETKVANIYPDGTIEVKATIPAICKTLMSQTKKCNLTFRQTLVKTYLLTKYKFKTDLHTHMNGNLTPDCLIALGIAHQIAYPLYYIKKLNLSITEQQQNNLNEQRELVSQKFNDCGLSGKYLTRKIDDNTFINFADLILNNIADSNDNIAKIRCSLEILKDSQAVFTNLEKLYLYRYVFTKGSESKEKINLINIEKIEDNDIRSILEKMIEDDQNPLYANNTLFQDKLLWIGREYQKYGIQYVQISDTTLVKKDGSAIKMLQQVHDILPKVEKETGVVIRFLAAMRRTPLTIVKDNVTPENYLRDNIDVLKAIAKDPYVVGCDFVGEEINDIKELQPVINEIVDYCNQDPYFTIRIHAGENDSLKNNVANSIACVKNALKPGQKMPYIRIGHGLYTANLNSKAGKNLINEIKDNNVILEFQLTSNVRLNNLTKLSSHPLKQYLQYGIKAVQGSDGCGLYGISSIDEQLSLISLLGLNNEEMQQMCQTEREIISLMQESFTQKSLSFEQYLNGKPLEDVLSKDIEKNLSESQSLKLAQDEKLLSFEVLNKQIAPLPLDKLPIIIAGGSFNTLNRTTHTTNEEKKYIDALLNNLNPEEIFFVVGHKISGYEKYLIDNNQKGFDIFAYVPSLIDNNEYKKLKKSGLKIRISTESLGMGIYKSFNYEIFERRNSIIVALDGNSAGANLIQEGKNGKGKALIFVSDKSKALKEKASSLSGYANILTDSSSMLNKVFDYLSKRK